MENNEEARGDIFTDAWEDETGGIVADSRRDEELPQEPDPAEEAGDLGDRDRAGESGGDIQTGDPAGQTPAAGGGGAAAAQIRDRDILEFVREYPEVTAEDIPQSVWRRVAAGESLAAAYSRHEAAVLRRDNGLLRDRLAMQEQARINRERSAGSQLGAGTGRAGRDPFDDGWELEW